MWWWWCCCCCYRCCCCCYCCFVCLCFCLFVRLGVRGCVVLSLLFLVMRIFFFFSFFFFLFFFYVLLHKPLQKYPLSLIHIITTALEHLAAYQAVFTLCQFRSVITDYNIILELRHFTHPRAERKPQTEHSASA